MEEVEPIRYLRDQYKLALSWICPQEGFDGTYHDSIGLIVIRDRHHHSTSSEIQAKLLDRSR